MRLKDYQFIGTQWTTPRQKQLILGDWYRFLTNRFARAHFTKRLYHHLTLHCSFIAHYNLDGFYEEYFVHGADTVHFLSQFDSRGPCLSVEYRVRYWLEGDYNDLHQAMIDVATPLIPDLIVWLKGNQEQEDLRTANALLAKHGRQPVQ